MSTRRCRRMWGTLHQENFCICGCNLYLILFLTEWWETPTSCFRTDLSLTTWLHVGPQCIRMGSIRTTSGGWTRLQCSCTVTSAPALLGTSSAGGGQGSPPHKHPAHTQTPSPYAFFFPLCSDGVCLLCFITHSSIFQRRSHTFVSGWDLIREEPLCRSFSFSLSNAH